MNNENATLPHHKLFAYQLAIEWLKMVHETPIRDPDQRMQARKSAKSAARNLAEGAGRWSRADKARVYAIARGEVCEACAAVEIAGAIGCASAENVVKVNAMGKRLSDMIGREQPGSRVTIQTGTIGNRFLKFLPGALVAGRYKVLRFRVEEAKVESSEADEEQVVFDFPEANPLTSERRGQVELDPSKSRRADVATAADQDRSVVQGIVDLWKLAGEAANGGRVERGWRTLAKGLVRAFRVVFGNEALETLLLLKQSLGSWSCGFGFEGSVHALMPPVLLRVPWLDSFVPNSKPKPPDGKSAQAE